MASERGIIRPHAAQVDFSTRFSDAAMIALTLWVAAAAYPEAWDHRHSTAASLGVLVFYLVAQANGVYREWRSEPLKRELAKVLMAWAISAPVLLLLAFLTKSSQQYSRQVMLTWFAAVPVSLSLVRFIGRAALHEARQRGHNQRNTAIVGASALGEELSKVMARSAWMGMKLVGFYDDRHPSRLRQIDPSLGEVVGDLDALVEQARNGFIDVVYIALPLRAEPRINSIIRRLADSTASVYLAYDFGGFDVLRAQWGQVGDVPVMSVVENPFHGVDGVLKRVEDLVLGSIIVALLTVPMLAIAMAVRLTSPGPVIFRQYRYGLNGERIRVFKFRTMYVTEEQEKAEAEDQAEKVVEQAKRDDPRITPLGSFLRRNSLDELPQFLQVLTGEMSIVGPRPHAVVHNERYRELIQGYMLRHKVKPGITGWAQVNGWRGETDTLEKMEKRVEYDLQYIRNWGLWWDIQIIFMTIFGGLRGDNAY